MARLFDRVLAYGPRVSLYDLQEAHLHVLDRNEDGTAARKHAERLQDPEIIRSAKAIRPHGNGLKVDAWTQATVVSADNVVRYLAEFQIGEDDLHAMLANIAVVPAYEHMFVEARCIGPGMLAGASAFGWSVKRENDANGGWLMTAELVLEWRKGNPIGPIAVLHWRLDERGRYVADETRKPLTQAQFPESPDHPGVLSNLCESFLMMADGATGVLLMTLGMMHCKNVQTSVMKPEVKQSQRHQRRHGNPLTRYHVLDVRPVTRALDTDGDAKRDGIGAALHRCRGHFKTFRPDAPLFGKLTGQYWWNAHQRGDRRNGAIKAAYRVHPPTGDGVGVVYEGRLAELLPTSGTAEEISSDRSAHAKAAHDAIQDQLAAALEQAGLTPLRPAPHEPQYDLAWQRGNELWIAEVKSTTASNEIRQVRAAIGQVLHYRSELGTADRVVRAAIATEHPVNDATLIEACRTASIVLTSPPEFGHFIRAHTGRAQDSAFIGETN